MKKIGLFTAVFLLVSFPALALPLAVEPLAVPVESQILPFPGLQIDSYAVSEDGQKAEKPEKSVRYRGLDHTIEKRTILNGQLENIDLFYYNRDGYLESARYLYAKDPDTLQERHVVLYRNGFPSVLVRYTGEGEVIDQDRLEMGTDRSVALRQYEGGELSRAFVYRFDDAGRIVLKDVYNEENYSWFQSLFGKQDQALLKRTEYTYDSSGFLKEISFRDYEEDRFTVEEMQIEGDRIIGSVYEINSRGHNQTRRLIEIHEYRDYNGAQTDELDPSGEMNRTGKTGPVKEEKAPAESTSRPRE